MLQNSQRRWGLLLLALTLMVLSAAIGLGVVAATEQVQLGREPSIDAYSALPIMPPTATVTATRRPTVTVAAPAATDTPVLPTATSTVPPIEPTATSTLTPTVTVETEPTVTATATESAPTATATAPADIVAPTVPIASVLKSTIASPVGTNLRAGPSVESAVVAVLLPEAPVTLLRRTADSSWVYLLAPDAGRPGWVRSDQIAPVDLSSLSVSQ